MSIINLKYQVQRTRIRQHLQCYNIYLIMLDQEFLSSIPHAPGVYLMLNKASTVLYVGKAKDLFKRLSTYLHYSGPGHSKTSVMLRQVSKIETLMTNTEKEALILESSLIKKHRPKYNVILRDDKSYPYIKVTTQEEWPRVFMTRRKKRDGARYFGPYSSSSAMWSTLKLLYSLFPLRRCKGSRLKPRKRPCLNHQMSNCLAPCAGKADMGQYQEMVNNVIMFLEGRNKRLIKNLKKEMTHAAELQKFEKAALLRDRIVALEKTLEKQIVLSNIQKNRDVFGFYRQGVSVSVALLYIRKGILGGSRRFFLEDPYGDDQAILSQVLKQLYDESNLPPSELLLPHDFEDRTVMAERLSDLSAKIVTLNVPQRGEPKELIRMAHANARQLLDEQDNKKRSWNDLAENMMKKLHLPVLPQQIECLDISNISGMHAVGSLVSFYSGEPAPGNYRHYKIKTVKGPDDYAMMREVIHRRFSRALQDNDLPDLFMVDGGKGQLGVAEAVAYDLGLTESVNLIGIAKEREDEGEKLYRPGRKNPILLPPHNPLLLYLMKIRDEAHRFGITFHRSLRRKQSFSSPLDQIPGVGKEKKKMLLKTIGSLHAVSRASIEDLRNVVGIGPTLAMEIHLFFNRADTDL